MSKQIQGDTMQLVPVLTALTPRRPTRTPDESVTTQIDIMHCHARVMLLIVVLVVRGWMVAWIVVRQLD